MGEDRLELMEPALELMGSYMDFLNAYRKELRVPPVHADPEETLRKLEDEVRGIGLPQGWVPQSTFWLVLNGRVVVGSAAFRHELTPSLEVEGGHIGYIIHPDYRQRGYGTKILALMLEIARKRGYTRVLLTCNTDNIPSVKIIVKNGGQFAGETVSPRTEKYVSRYWIDL